MLARPPAADPRVKSLCSEFNIEIISRHVYPLPGQTRAVATIRRIIDRHGEAHARLVLCTLSENKGNGGLLDEVSLWAVSDLILACPRYVERTSAWLKAWDRLPLGQFMFITQELSGVVKQRHALAGMAYLWLRSVLDRAQSLAKPVKPQPARGIVSPGCVAA